MPPPTTTRSNVSEASASMACARGSTTSVLQQPALRRLRRRAGILAEELLEAAGRGRCVGGAVVVEHRAHVLGELGEAADARGHLLELVVAVLPAEALRHGLTLEVALGVAAVGAQ